MIHASTALNLSSGSLLSSLQYFYSVTSLCANLSIILVFSTHPVFNIPTSILVHYCSFIYGVRSVLTLVFWGSMITIERIRITGILIPAMVHFTTLWLASIKSIFSPVDIIFPQCTTFFLKVLFWKLWAEVLSIVFWLTGFTTHHCLYPVEKKQAALTLSDVENIP